MILKPLGTVSPYCKGTKNCPGFLVSTGKEKILLDCGNGITRNLTLPDDLENLTIIISHLHRDHYADLFSIAYASYVFHNLGYLDKRIKVYIPEADYVEDAESYRLGCARHPKIQLVDYTILQNLGEEHYLDITTYNSQTKLTLSNTQITFSDNPHNITSHSIKISSDNQTLVYSGDTGYIGNSLEKFAYGSNLLICESTFLKGQPRKQDYHLYAHEAAKIASTAKVEKLLLTHFWPDIDKEEYVKEASLIFPNTEAAVENQILKLSPHN